MINKTLKGERKWTSNIKKIIMENVLNTEELKKYRISCDSDKNKKTLCATVSLNKYIINTSKKNCNKIENFTNNKFHPDILIEEIIKDNEVIYSIPRIAIEVKYKGTSFTPHEVLAYNYKADLHKKLYSGLRYGLIIGNSNYINKATIKFCNNFDFILSLSDIVSEIINKNLLYSKKLEHILDGKNRDNFCIGLTNDIIFKNDK